jgi:hypothetical protein
MAKDTFTAVIANNTTDAYMVVLNGNLEDNKNPEQKDFAIIGPGESSDAIFSSIDALALYSIKDHKPVIVKIAEVNSDWWKVPDGNHGSIKTNTNGTVSLDTSYNIPFSDASPISYHLPGKPPIPSKALDWDFKPEYLDALLKERESKLPATKTLEPMSKLESTNSGAVPTTQTETLLAYLAKSHNAEDSVRILQAMQARVAELDHAI